MWLPRTGHTSPALRTLYNTLNATSLTAKSGPEVIKKSCSTQLSMKFFLLINVKMPTTVGILTFMSMKISIPDLSELEKKLNFL